jgi:hypothetical protein
MAAFLLAQSSFELNAIDLGLQLIADGHDLGDRRYGRTDIYNVGQFGASRGGSGGGGCGPAALGLRSDEHHQDHQNPDEVTRHV